jgi:hypothetical protein
MALDHFVSQVYLRKFLAPKLGNRMYAMRKSDLAMFTPRPRDVCRIENGNTNHYLTEERIIEEFLAKIEPRYNASVDCFYYDVPDPENIFTIAGIISYFMTCSPAAMRISSGPLRAQVESVARHLDEQKAFPQPPKSLAGGTLSDMLNDGRVEIQIDPQYPSAIGIAKILKRVSVFGNSCWDIMTNSNEGCEFFTSDYPVAIEPTSNPRILSRLVPLTPNIAVRIIPDSAYSRAEPDLKFPGFRYRKFEIDAAEARRLNQLLVRCAEDIVLASDWQDWRPRFIEKHRHYRLDTITNNIPVGRGELMHSRIEIIPHKQMK